MTVVPTQCGTALKEWATVLEALARGEQWVLIRKGGLIEPDGGFDVVQPWFVFYPTFEHQAVRYLRPEYQGYFASAAQHRAPDGCVRFNLCGLAVRTVQSADGGLVERLRRFHIYNEDFLIQRMKCQPQEPLTVVVVRTSRLVEPCQVPVAAAYAGCKSWVQLDAPVDCASAEPAVEEGRFNRQLGALAMLLED